MISVGFIGFGRFAKLRHGILSELQDVDLKGYFDPDIIDNQSVGLKSFSSPEALLDAVDAVLISVPPHFAPEYCKLALSRKVHVFCEKPPATDPVHLEGLDKLSQNMVLAYGFNHRLHSSVQKIKEIVDSGSMGKILWMRGRYGKETDEDYKWNWRCNPTANGGGILIDQGIHLLDIMDWLAGGFDVTQAILSNNFLNIDGIEDNVFLNLCSSKNKISASLHSTITQWRYMFSLEIFLEKGSLVLNGLRTSSGNYGDEVLSIRPRSDGKGENDREIKFEQNLSWRQELLDFLRCIDNSEPYPHAGIAEAHNIMVLLKEIYSNAHWLDGPRDLKA